MSKTVSDYKARRFTVSIDVVEVDGVLQQTRGLLHSIVMYPANAEEGLIKGPNVELDETTMPLKANQIAALADTAIQRKIDRDDRKPTDLVVVNIDGKLTKIPNKFKLPS